MLSKVLDTITKYNMLKKGDNVIVAVSGGPDSIALLYSLYKLKKKLGINELIVAHLNHMLRGKDAEEDAHFVKEISQKLGLKAVIGKRNVSELVKKTGLSTEDAARRERYAFLYEVASQYDAKIAVGHHADDQAETILMHLIKGSGTQGLAAIEPVRDIIIRPLLNIRRTEIEEFCKKNNLETRLDKTNTDVKYLRNKIRHRLIPYLVENYNPNLVNNLIQTVDIIQKDNLFLETYTSKVLNRITLDKSKEFVTLSLPKFLKEDLAIKRRVIRACYLKLTNTNQNLNFRHVEAVLDLCENSQVGSQFKLPNGITVKKTYDTLIIGFLKKEKEEVTFFYKLKIPGTTLIPEINTMIKTELIDKETFNFKKERNLSGKGKEVFIDYEKLKNELYVRNRKKGDRFVPFGMKGTKKLKDFFIDNKVPREKRDFIPIIVTEENEIVWVTGYRISNKYRVDKNTKKILKITFENQTFFKENTFKLN